MRFATFSESRRPRRAGVVSDAGIHPLPAGVTVLDLVRSGLPAALAAGERALGERPVPLPAVRLLPPLAPPTVRDFVAFEEHVEGVAASAGIGRERCGGPRVVPGADVLLHQPVRADRRARRRAGPAGVASCSTSSSRSPSWSAGQRLRNITGASLTPEQAREHIFGYTVLNDWSARDLQRREMKVLLGPAKGKDSATTLGPWLVTADELEPYRDADGFLALDLRASVNGERSARTCCPTWAGRSRS